MLVNAGICRSEHLYATQIRLVSSKKHGTRYKVNHRKGDNRVNRGGSWNNNAENCRVSNRNNNTPTNRNNNIGFRLSLQRMMRAGWLLIHR
ncbi:MAG: SUMF1/EgtB/PvdO family nonheme iron enzyme [Saprospiraceae bacterium]